MRTLFKVLAISTATLVSATAAMAQNMTGAAHAEEGQCKLIVYFALDNDTLTAEDMQVLDNLIAKYPKAHVTGTGRTDALASAAYNLDLSKRRVMRVVNYLKTHGGQDMTFDLSGVGKSELVINVPGSEAKNRLVDLNVANCNQAYLTGPAVPASSLTSGAALAGVGLVGLLLLLSNQSTTSTTNTSGTNVQK